MKSPKALLFDLDGTLLDTAPDLGAALNHVLAQYGLPQKTYDEYRVESSNGALGLLKMGMGKHFHKHDSEVLRQQLLDFYLDNICRYTKPFVGIKEVITFLDEQNIPWGIITNKPEFLTTPLLAHFAEFKNCKVCFSGDSFAQRKPHPEPLNQAAERLSISADKIWYVGDAERDMVAARAAKMISVLARYGYLTPTELQQHWDVDISVETAQELLQVLNESVFG